jgi:2-hydroxy-4-carboxymuconate semialdehyde hemiacetal dehydrogenase
MAKSGGMNLCFVGCGAIAGVHADICRRLGHRLHTVMGRVPQTTQAFARDYGFARTTFDLDEALAQREIDAVIICSPSEAHEAQARQVIEAGKPVLIELPLAMTYAGGAALAELAKQRGVTAMVAHTQRYMPAVRAVRDEIATGRLHVHHVLARFLFFRRRNVGWTGRVRSWADNLLWHHSCHMVDTCLWVLGMPPVHGLAVRGRIGPLYLATRIPMDLDISIATPTGTLVNIGMSYHSEDMGLDFLFVGEERTLHIAEHTLLHRDTVLYDAAAHHEYIANELQDREFFAALAEERQSEVTPFDVLPSLAVLQQVEDQNPTQPRQAVEPAVSPRVP